MRCANLTATWAELTGWLERRNVLVLPPLTANLPLVRLAADLSGTGDIAEVECAIDRLHRLIDHFDVQAVYVERTEGTQTEIGDNAEPAILTIRILAAGAVHELKLFATWYAELLDAVSIT